MADQQITLAESLTVQADLRIRADMIRLAESFEVDVSLPLTLSNVVGWLIKVDWNNDGTWEDKENINSDVLSLPLRTVGNFRPASHRLARFDHASLPRLPASVKPSGASTRNPVWASWQSSRRCAAGVTANSCAENKKVSGLSPRGKP